MTVLASLSSRYQTIALECRRDWSQRSIQCDLDQLLNPRRLGADPSGASRRHVALNTFHTGMRPFTHRPRIQASITWQLAPQKLKRLHMLHSSIGDLGTNEKVEQRNYSEKPSQ